MRPQTEQERFRHAARVGVSPSIDEKRNLCVHFTNFTSVYISNETFKQKQVWNAAIESVLIRIAITSADSHTNIGEQKLHTSLKHEMKNDRY